MQRLFLFTVVSLALLFLVPPRARASECPVGDACVADEDLLVFSALLREKKCLQDTPPTVDVTPITIVTDKEGRVYYSGAQPHPFTITTTWCNYTLVSQAKLNVTVAQSEARTWGFRFRPKFGGSFLLMDALERSAASAVDVGLLWDFFFWRELNVNVATGFRSAGLGVGYDLTKNFGAFGGLAFSFWTLRLNPQAGLYFGFW
jgi:hypothetical protein